MLLIEKKVIEEILQKTNEIEKYLMEDCDEHQYDWGKCYATNSTINKILTHSKEVEVVVIGDMLMDFNNNAKKGDSVASFIISKGYKLIKIKNDNNRKKNIK